MLLKFIYFFLIISLIFIFFTPQNNLFFLRLISLSSSSIVLILSILLFNTFDFNLFYFQNVLILNFELNVYNYNFIFGLDGISIFFFVLTSLLIFLCILFSWNSIFLKEYVLNLLLIELLLLIVFSVLDLFLFYVFFEIILIPMFILIGFLGSRARKIRAAYLIFFYTLFGSVLMLSGMLYIYNKLGTLNFEYIYAHSFTFQEQQWLFLAFFLSFASKIPMFPLHIWLPEAHVEAPTVGSVLLAGILLKLGVYGFLRFSLTMFPDASLYFSPLICLLSLVGIVYTSFTALRQTDIKRIIAYSSIAHMNLVTLGIFSFTINGVEGSLLQSISHGFVSGGLFFMVGILYDRYHSRLLYYYSGLVHVMPIYSTLLLILILSNMALPGTSSFIGEFLLLSGIYKMSVLVCIISTLGVLICGAYSLWLYNRLIFGNLKISYTLYFKDLNLREFLIIFILVFLIIFMGLYPSLYLKGIKFATNGLSFFV